MDRERLLQEKRELANKLKAGDLSSFEYDGNKKSNDFEEKENIDNTTSDLGSNVSEEQLNPINPKYKSKYQLADEYLRLCKEKNISSLTNLEIKKMTVKMLQDEVLRVSKLPSAIIKTDEQKKSYESVAMGFYNFNCMLAVALENMTKDSESVPLSGMTEKIVNNKESLHRIAEQLYQEQPEVMSQITNPYMALAGVWGMAAVNTVFENKKKKQEIQQKDN